MRREDALPGADRVVLTAASGPREWDSAVLGLPGAVPFHAWDFLVAAAEAWGVRFEPLVARRGPTVIGGVPRLVERRVGLRWVNHLNLLNFIGPAARPEDLAAVLAAVARLEPHRTVRERQEVRLAPTAAPEVTGWRRRTATSMVVPLASRTREEVLAQGSRNFRKDAARLARKYGTVIEPATEPDLRIALPRLMEQVFGRQGLAAPYTPETYWRVYQAFAARGTVHALTARIEGEVASIAVALLDPSSEIAYEWVAADDPRFRRAEVSLAVQRAMILWAHETGYAGYELLGGSTEGLTAFKRSMGAQEFPYSVYVRGLRA